MQTGCNDQDQEQAPARHRASPADRYAAHSAPPAHAAARTAAVRQLIARSVLHGPTLRTLLAGAR